MNVTKLGITNFRCIKDISMEFDPRINVFIGENGSGKTAVIDAISAILSPYSIRQMDESDITKGESFFSTKLVCETVDGIIYREYSLSIDHDDGVDCDGEIIPVYDISEFMTWFYDMEYEVGGLDKLETVIYALKEFLPDLYDLNVVSDPLRFVVTKRNGEVFDMCQLSSGEVAIIEMVGILAMRMIVNYPTPDNVLTGSGVVIIDEIDAHLHPAWQRMMVPKLLDVFPNCQFIVSTNSPHVVNHVRPESLFILEKTVDGIVVKKANETYGKSVDMVLKCIMGMDTTRPDEVHADLSRLFKTIDDGYMDDARDQIVRLLDLIGVDPELVKAGVLIKRIRSVGKQEL